MQRSLSKDLSRIQIHNEVTPDIEILADPSQLREVFINLIFNAADAMPEGGEVRIRARRLPEAVEIEVADTGVGMTEEVRAKMFDLFFTTKDKKGMGVGMSLPIWGRSLGSGYRQAKSNESAADLSLRDLGNHTLFEVEDLFVRADAALRQAKEDEESILPQIRSALKATLSGYESDAVGFLELLDVERTLLGLELAHVRHLVMFQNQKVLYKLLLKYKILEAKP